MMRRCAWQCAEKRYAGCARGDRHDSSMEAGLCRRIAGRQESRDRARRFGLHEHKALREHALEDGAHNYLVQDGEQLARAFKLAALQHLPCEILDKTSRVVASGETSQLARELPVGQFQLRMNVLGDELRAPAVVVANG